MPKHIQSVKKSPSEALSLELGFQPVPAPDAGTGVTLQPQAGESEQMLATAPLASNGTSQADEMVSLRSVLDRTKKALERQKASSRRARESLAEVKQQLEESREEVDEITARLVVLEKDVQQYRNWWLNEVQFTKLILNKLPNANEDWDLVRTSQSHYLGRF
ncbi:hypothetical protein BKA70DRAFT_1234419 [Coprinopsis sp. MPI-PUGE-AT-0042]|nr:hypothetical protein BKA70DRAFT_1234419 [Coprinopsis sp. MPI-PUGE-AT-0042]